jgi:hypothetical protein
VNTNGTWFQTSDVNGSVMIRPVFGKGDIVTDIQHEEHKPVSFYPNPNHGEFYFSEHIDQLSIFNITGQPVLFKLTNEGTRKLIRMDKPSSGLYLIKYRIGNDLKVGKILVRD